MTNPTTLSGFTGRLLQTRTCNNKAITHTIAYVNGIGLTANSIARNIHRLRKWLTDNSLNATLHEIVYLNYDGGSLKNVHTNMINNFNTYITTVRASSDSQNVKDAKL